MAGVMAALFLSALDQTVVSTAMPRIITDLGGLDRFTWVVTAYLVASTAAVPIVGKLSDMYGRKSFLIGGIVIFLVGSALAGLSQTMNQLIVFRAVQGLGGGVMMAIAFVSVADLFPPADRGKYQGFIAAVFGLSSVVGPVFGGLITDTLSWHWIFYINIPLGIPIIALFVRYFPNPPRAQVRHRPDYPGIVLLMLAVVPLLIGLSWGGVQYAWGSAQVVTALAVSLAAVILFVVAETRASEPVMPLSIYRNRVVTISLTVSFLTGFAMFSGFLFIPLFFQGVLGASATSSGSFLTPMMLGIVFGAILSGQSLSRLGGHYRSQGLLGIAVMGVGMFLISRMSADTSFAGALVNIVLMGFGLGITFPAFTIAVQNAVPHSVVGVATSATQFYRTIGGTMGLAALGAVMASGFASRLARSLPDSVVDAVPPDLLAELTDNPQALVNPDAMTVLRDRLSGLGPESAEVTRQLVDTLRESLASAIGEVFLVGLVALGVAFLATLLLTEIPLRRAEDATEPVPASAAEG